LVETLLKRGERVRVLDDFSTGRRENLAPFQAQLELIEGSITDPATCVRACQGTDYVLHQAALPSVPRSIQDPATSNAVNVTGTLNVLMAARDAGVKRVVYAASSSAYGDTDVTPKHEGLLPRPKSPYAVGKLTGEYYCRCFSEAYDLDTVSLRYFNVFGPRQDPNSPYSAVIPRFITALLEGRPPVVYGDGTQSRDFTYVSNNVEANLLAATLPGPFRGEVFNIACGEEYTLLDLLAALGDLIGVKAEPEFQPRRKGDVLHSRADIARASERLGFRPVAGFREGLERTVEHFRVQARA
jgi:nucleoside-diphosphate-sugar epimerase